MGKLSEHVGMLENRLRKRGRHLSRWATRSRVSCYRLYDRDIPEIPLQIDRYGDDLHVSWLVPPLTLDPGPDHPWLRAMIEALEGATDVPADRIFVKLRQRLGGYERQAREGVCREVQEAGLTFEVNLSDFIDTGLFLDHRLTRAMVRDASEGKRVLNLYAYTGAFTVYAAAGGAASTMTIDLSRRYLSWAQRNLALNGLDTPNHERHAGDVMEQLRRWRGVRSFDLAVIDPPTYSTSPRMDGDFDVQRDHVHLIEAVRDVMAPDGVMFFSTNSRRFSPDLMLEGAEITQQTTPEDFRRSRPHRCWRLG